MNAEPKQPHRKYQAWEYKIDVNVVTETALNKYGLQGWELVSYTPGPGGFGATAVFKRPIPDRTSK